MKNTLVLFSVGLTALLLGVGLTYYLISQQLETKLSDKAFLEKQIQRIEAQNPDGQKAPRKLPSVRVCPVEQKPISDERLFDGRIVEIQKVILSCEVAGLIKQMPVELGDKVYKGKTLIAEIDTTWLSLAHTQTEKEKEAKQAEMQLQKTELDRMERLFEMGGGALSASDLDKQRTLTEQAVALYKLSVAMEEETREKLERTKIYAPFNGAIISKKSELGAYVSSGTPLVEIVSSGEVDALFHIYEDNVERIKVGDRILVRVCPLNEEVSAEVVSIVPCASTAARTFPVRFRLNDEEGKIKVGMSVQCVLPTSDKREQLTVVRDAVLDKPDGATVWVAQPQADGAYQATPVPVYIQARAQDYIAVRPVNDSMAQFLQKNALAVVEGAERLMPQQTVAIKELDKRFLKDLPTAAGMQTFAHEKGPALQSPQATN